MGERCEVSEVPERFGAKATNQRKVTLLVVHCSFLRCTLDLSRQETRSRQDSYAVLKSMEHFLVIFQSGSLENNFFGLLVWKKEIIFQT